MGCRVGRFSHLVMNPRLRLEAVTEGWKDMKSRTDCGASHIQRNTKAEVHSIETCPTLCIFVENNSYRSKHNDPKYNTQSFATTTQRPKRRQECWLSWTFLHSQLTSTPLKIYGGHWKPDQSWAFLTSEEALWNIARSRRGYAGLSGFAQTCGVQGAWGQLSIKAKNAQTFLDIVQKFKF